LTNDKISAFDEYLIEVHLSYLNLNEGLTEKYKMDYLFYFNCLRRLFKDIQKYKTEQKLEVA